MDSIERLLEVMARLRDPETGCPWDLDQDFSTIAPFTIEEAYEVADAIARVVELAEDADGFDCIFSHQRCDIARGRGIPAAEFVAVVGIALVGIGRMIPLAEHERGGLYRTQTAPFCDIETKHLAQLGERGGIATHLETDIKAFFPG